jgi:outer membrane protein OmpA-like peptidoglycan-associated protein
MDLAGQYKADLRGESVQAELIDAEVEFAGFKLNEKGSDVELISVPSFIVKGVNADLNEKEAVVASVHSSDGWFLVVRTRDGKINYEKLIQAELLADKPTETDEPPADEAQTWQIRVNEMVFENYGARLESYALAKPVVVTLDSINANLKNLSNQKNSEAEFKLALSIEKKGKVEIEGIASADPVSADLNLRVSNTPMLALQAYLDTLTQVQLASAQVNWDFRLQYNRFGKDGPLLRLEGDTSIDDIQLVERSSGEDLAKCESLAASGLSFDVDPGNLSVSDIVIKKPYAKVIVFPDATVNLANAFATKETEASEESLLIFEKVVRAFELQLQQDMPINIDSVRIETGTADFADLSIKPNFAADIRDLNGTVKGLSSKPQTRADVLLEGKANRHAPVKITGQLNPLSPDVYIDLALSFKNMELTRLSPYSGRFAGYLIEKGKMSVDLKYEVSGNTLVGENEIVLNQLTLGERVDSPDATSLPVGLAIALLKDRNGNIELDVPVSGDLKDPQFNIGGVVAKAVGQVITKIVTSPFALLGSLVGGGSREELDFIDFEFGSAALSATQIEKLDTLSKALNERPALRLEIQGAADKQSDGVALAEAELLNQLKLARVEELQEAGKTVPARVDDLTLSYEDYARLITQRYIDKFGKDPKTIFLGESESAAEKRQAIDQEVIISTAKQKLVETTPVDESRLKGLAQERAMQIKDHLVEKGKISNDRLYLREAEIIDTTDGESIRAHLTLSGA